jgi:hypothetical protein
MTMSTQSNTAGTNRWELTAPESWALMNGVVASTQPFKLALTELLMRGALKIVESTGRLRGKTVLLVDGPKAQPPSEPVLAPIWELYRGSKTKTTDQGTGVEVKDLAKAAQSEFGGVSGYVAKHVAPRLSEHGLIEWRPKKVLFVFNSGKWELTPTGEAKKAELQRILDEGQANIEDWVSSDPTRAVAYLGAAGAAILLAPTLFPQLRQLADVSTSDLDFDFGDDFDVGSLDSMDSAFDAIDSSVDSGGSDGGSDGGGSDGGGSDGGGSSD